MNMPPLEDGAVHDSLTNSVTAWLRVALKLRGLAEAWSSASR